MGWWFDWKLMGVPPDCFVGRQANLVGDETNHRRAWISRREALYSRSIGGHGRRNSSGNVLGDDSSKTKSTGCETERTVVADTLECSNPARNEQAQYYRCVCDVRGYFYNVINSCTGSRSLSICIVFEKWATTFATASPTSSLTRR